MSGHWNTAHLHISGFAHILLYRSLPSTTYGVVAAFHLDVNTPWRQSSYTKYNLYKIVEDGKLKHMRLLAATLGVVVLTAVGCVIRTEHRIDAHIRLDIRHIQDQAEQVLDFVEGRTDALPEFEEAAANGPEETTSWLRRGLHMLNPMPTAHASELRQSSPRVREIAENMRQNHDEVSRFKRLGCFGETNRGLLEMRECDALSVPEDRNAAQQLLAEENRDRKALYQEIARLNQEDNVTVATVERVYALERLRRANAGEHVQLPPAGDAFEELRESNLGRRLGDQLQPNAWVVIP